MADEVSRQDPNHVPALIVHSGTAGTAQTRRVTSQNTAGAVDVHIAGGTVSASATTANAINTFGTTGTIADGVTGTIIDYVTPANFKLKGFVASGEGQGFYYLEIGAGTTKYVYRPPSTIGNRTCCTKSIDGISSC